MKTHLRNSKTDTMPACKSNGTNRGVYGVAPKYFIENINNDQCEKCLVIYTQRKIDREKMNNRKFAKATFRG